MCNFRESKTAKLELTVFIRKAEIRAIPMTTKEADLTIDLHLV